MKYEIARLTGTLGNILEILNKKCEADKMRVHSFQVHERENKAPTYTFLLEPAPLYHIQLPIRTDDVGADTPKPSKESMEREKR